MKTRTGILREAQHRLEQKEVPFHQQERLLELLNLLMSVMDDSLLQDDSFSKRLLDVIADNGNLLTVIQRQAAELDALKGITLNLTSNLDLQAVLDGVVKEAMQLVKDAQDAHIYLFQDEKLIFGASLKTDSEKNIQYTEPRPDGLTRTVALEKKMIIVEDMMNHPLYASVPKTWRGSIIGIPLKMDTRVVGVMNLARTRTGEFSQSEIRLLTILADQAAIAIKNAHLHAAATQQARSDSLTNLPNRRALDEHLEEEIKRSKRSGIPFSVVMMDLDGFKIINDTFGHEVGDEVLQVISSSFQKALRATDFLARYGGDEMTIILPETDWPQVLIVTDKIQNELRQLVFKMPSGEQFSLSVTGGVAIYPRHATESAGLLRTADEALYRAKRHRRGEFIQGRPGTGVLLPPDT